MRYGVYMTRLLLIQPEPVPEGDLIDWSDDDDVPAECTCRLAEVDHLGECQACHRPVLRGRL